MNSITIELDDFEYLVVTKLTEINRRIYSATIRFIVSSWIQNNPELLKSKFGMDLNEIMKELKKMSKKSDKI